MRELDTTEKREIRRIVETEAGDRLRPMSGDEVRAGGKNRELGTTGRVRTGGLKELLIVYFLAFLLLLAILWYVDMTTGLVLQFTLNCNTYMVERALRIW